MAEFLALDWDDQQLLALDAQVAPTSVHVRKRVHFEWTADARPFEHAEAAGKQLRLELDRAGIAATKALVSLPREEAVVRLLELPECDDNELPELVRLQAATRSAVPLDRLLLDFLPLPRLENVAGRRVLMVTLGKVPADRIQTILKTAGLEAAGILLSAVGTAEIVAHQPRVSGVSDEAATLIVSRSGSRLEITAIWRKQILFMHAANVSAHLPPEAGISQILAETSRATVALSQAAPGIRIGSGWILSSAAELAGLPEAFKQRFGFEFQTLDTAFRTPGVRADFDPAGTTGQTAFSPLGLLFGQADGLVSSIDFLHPRQKVVKPDRRRLRQALAGGAVLAAVVAVFAGIHMRVARLDDEIAKMEADNASREATLKKNAALLATAKTLDDWTDRNIDWLDQFQKIEKAIGGTDNLHFSSFDGQVTYLDTLATISATGRAKTRHDVESMNEHLSKADYAPRAKEIVTDPNNPEFPEKFDLSVEIKVPKKGIAPTPAAGRATAGKREGKAADKTAALEPAHPTLAGSADSRTTRNQE
jgi:hypothetical protein